MQRNPCFPQMSGYPQGLDIPPSPPPASSVLHPPCSKSCPRGWTSAGFQREKSGVSLLFLYLEMFCKPLPEQPRERAECEEIALLCHDVEGLWQAASAAWPGTQELGWRAHVAPLAAWLSSRGRAQESGHTQSLPRLPFQRRVNPPPYQRLPQRSKRSDTWTTWAPRGESGWRGSRGAWEYWWSGLYSWVLGAGLGVAPARAPNTL